MLMTEILVKLTSHISTLFRLQIHTMFSGDVPLVEEMNSCTFYFAHCKIFKQNLRLAVNTLENSLIGLCFLIDKEGFITQIDELQAARRSNHLHFQCFGDNSQKRSQSRAQGKHRILLLFSMFILHVSQKLEKAAGSSAIYAAFFV